LSHRNHQIVFELRQITKQYSKVSGIQAVKNISLQIRAGEFLILFGPSGCGKSTLLNILYGLESPTSGEVFLRGKNLFNMDDKELDKIHRQKIGYVFQQFSFLRTLTVIDNVCLPQMFGDKKISQRKKRAYDLLKLFSLEEYANRYPQELSGGQQQRISLARAMMNNPRILFLDEPTGNLDQKTGDKVMNVLKDINRHSHKTIVMVTHNRKYVDYAHRAIFMQDGEIASEKNYHRLLFLSSLAD